MSSILKVDTIQDQSGNNIINESSDTITIGASGDTITIPAGATFSATITAPVIDEINDTNGNEEIIFTTTASAVNELTIANAATGNAPEIAATGDDTNIDLRLNTKGTGGVVFNAGAVGTPSITTTGDTNTGIFFPAADTIGFAEGGTERMRIDSDGNVLVGTTGISTGTFKGIQNAAGGANANYLSRNSLGTADRVWTFGMNAADEYVVYGIQGISFNTGAYIAWGGTSWTAQSDERSKDIIEPIADAVNKVSTLRAVIGKYKTDEEGKRRSFLIAQDVQAVLPEAVDASKPDNLGVQYTEVIPLLVAAIKELKEIKDVQTNQIQTLEARITTLENN
jgi:DNA-binding cell septation regulator SpoVG